MSFDAAMLTAVSGLRAQTKRLRVVAENIANADTTASTPGGDPYRRKTITFQSELDRASGAAHVAVKDIGRDGAAFKRTFEPGHPSADAEGYVLRPNISTIVEMIDMQEAQRSYEANLSMLTGARSMLQRTIDLLRS